MRHLGTQLEFGVGGDSALGSDNLSNPLDGHAVSGRHAKIIKSGSDLQMPDLPTGDSLDVHESPLAKTARQIFGSKVPEGYDHAVSKARFVDSARREDHCLLFLVKEEQAREKGQTTTNAAPKSIHRRV